MAWERMDEDEIAKWRKSITSDQKKGHQREFNTAWDTTLPTADTADGSSTDIELDPLPSQPALRKDIADDVFKMIYEWATSNRRAYTILKQIMRHNHPEAYAHLSDDELEGKIREYAQTAARTATESVYVDNEWDKARHTPDLARIAKAE